MKVLRLFRGLNLRGSDWSDGGSPAEYYRNFPQKKVRAFPTGARQRPQTTTAAPVHENVVSETWKGYDAFGWHERQDRTGLVTASSLSWPGTRINRIYDSAGLATSGAELDIDPTDHICPAPAVDRACNFSGPHSNRAPPMQRAQRQ